jgi:hypothetical protein
MLKKFLFMNRSDFCFFERITPLKRFLFLFKFNDEQAVRCDSTLWAIRDASFRVPY